MRNFEKYAEAGQKKIAKYSRYDMQISNYNEILSLLEEQKITIIEALNKTFNAGVEAGTKIQAKRSAELNPKK